MISPHSVLAFCLVFVALGLASASYFRSMAGRRFTLAGLLLSITLIGLILAFVVPLWRYANRSASLGDRVIAIAMSADGSTAAALTGDGMLRVWDVETGIRLSTFQTRGGWELSPLALSSDGSLAAVKSSSRSVIRDETEVWDIGRRKLKQTLPASRYSQVYFSPVENVIVVEHAGALFLHRLDAGAGPGRPFAKARHAAFSPDGRTIAVGERGGIHFYDTATLVQRDGFLEFIAKYSIADCLAFSPDGKALAVLENNLHQGSKQIRAWDLGNLGSRQARVEPARDISSSITYLPDGRAIAVPDLSVLRILDHGTLRPLNFDTTCSELAAGLRGQHFVVADRGTVDLYDAATLQKVKRLLDANPKPSPILPLVGLCIWLAIFFKRRMRNQMQACPKCGGRFVPASKDDANTQCPACRADARLKTLSAEQATGEQRTQSQRNWRNLLLLDVLFAALVGMLARDRFGLLPTFLVALIGLPALVFVAVRLLRKWVILLPSTLSAEIATAEKAAGSPGQVRYVGEVFVWSAKGASLADEFEPQLAAVRQRLAELTGRLVSPSPRLRAFFFADGNGVVRYLSELGFRVEDQAVRRGLFVSAPAHRLLLSERGAQGQEIDSGSMLRSFLARHLIEQAGVPVACAWLADGLASMIAYESSDHERASLNRRSLAGIVAGHTIPAAEWLTGNRRRHGRPDLQDYIWLRQFQTQSWSLMEFLCGEGATADRRAAFQQLFKDADLQKRPAEAFERHFGCSPDELFAQWRASVESHGVGEHHPPSRDVADYLTRGPLAKISARKTPPRARVEAVRAWGERGYAFGAEQVIALLRGGDEGLRVEAVYALECVSGLALDSSAEAWEAWIEGVRSQSSEARVRRSGS